MRDRGAARRYVRIMRVLMLQRRQNKNTAIKELLTAAAHLGEENYVKALEALSRAQATLQQRLK